MLLCVFSFLLEDSPPLCLLFLGYIWSLGRSVCTHWECTGPGSRIWAGQDCCGGNGRGPLSSVIGTLSNTFIWGRNLDIFFSLLSLVRCGFLGQIAGWVGGDGQARCRGSSLANGVWGSCQLHLRQGTCCRKDAGLCTLCPSFFFLMVQLLLASGVDSNFYI